MGESTPDVLKLSGFTVTEIDRPDFYALRDGNGLREGEEIVVDINDDVMKNGAMFTTPREASRISIGGVKKNRVSTRNNIHIDIVLEPPMPAEAALKMACKIASLAVRAERE